LKALTGGRFVHCSNILGFLANRDFSVGY